MNIKALQIISVLAFFYVPSAQAENAYQESDGVVVMEMEHTESSSSRSTNIKVWESPVADQPITTAQWAVNDLV